MEGYGFYCYMIFIAVFDYGRFNSFFFDLEKVFEFEGTRLLTFFYHGGDLFGIVQNVPIEKNSDIPFFHSRASVEHHTANFFVRLSSDSVDSPYLSIFCDFEDFISSFKIKDVILCCDDGKMTTMSIASTEKPFRTTSIGLGWGDLCVANKFNPALNFRIIVV
ncbi:hypothetical protein P8452_21657 [Trifolium repens]|nr:hypothetical protein P8452_21657 [Trifolium repens]